MTRVAVYVHEYEGIRKRKTLFLAYTRYFTEGACVHDVETRGEQVKRDAIAEHKAKCLASAARLGEPEGAAPDALSAPAGPAGVDPMASPAEPGSGLTQAHNAATKGR